MQAVRIDLREFQDKGIAYDFAKHELILAIEQKKGIEMQDSCNLFRSDTTRMIDL